MKTARKFRVSLIENINLLCVFTITTELSVPSPVFATKHPPYHRTTTFLSPDTSSGIALLISTQDSAVAYESLYL